MHDRRKRFDANKKDDDVSVTTNRTADYHEWSAHRGGLGVQYLMKSFVGKKALSGSWADDLESIVGVYHSMANLCEISAEDKLKAIQVVISGGTLTYYWSTVQGWLTYDEAVCAIRLWYNNSDKRPRILTKWQSLQLTEILMSNPVTSQVEFLRNFVANLTSLQKKLDSYHPSTNREGIEL